MRCHFFPVMLRFRQRRVPSWSDCVVVELTTPFVPPPRSRPLRFRYTTYMGEEHPAESKVVVEFKTSDLFLTVVERRKFIKLVGSRYNPQTKMVKMSCEMFEHQAQNKRYLSDLVDKLLAEARVGTFCSSCYMVGTNYCVGPHGYV